MVKWYREKETFRHILWLTIIYGAAHWFLLVMTGKWWDDWVYANHNVEYMIEVFMQSSLPLEAFIKMSVWNLPYRWFVFVYFYLDGLLVYFILKKIDLFSLDACFWVAALFVTVPVNDARIMWICYGYSFWFLLFWVSFYLATFLKACKGIKKIRLRIISLFLLLLSFNLESTMLMTLLILFYLYYEDLKISWKWKEIKANIKKFFIVIVRYIDFLLAPIAWYVLDKVLFPGYGHYGGHSYIPWDSLLGIVIRSPLHALGTMKAVFRNYMDAVQNNIAKICIAVVFILYIISVNMINRRIDKRDKITNVPLSKNIYMLILGIFIYFICFFPYGVKRDASLETFLENSRDAMLLGIGVAILIYYSAYILFRENICKVVLIFVIMLGVLHFNFAYLVWQESYYQQLQLQDEIAENVRIRENNTFLVMYKNVKIIPKYYQNNGNSWAVTGEETRLFLTGVGRLDLLYDMNKDTWYLNAYGMKDYDYTDKEIDGIVFVNYADIGKGEILKQKVNELFNKKEFDNWIKSTKDIRYVPISVEESNKIWGKYESGELTDDLIYEWYYS